MTKKPSANLSRRLFLRGTAVAGAAVTLALPTFEFMLNDSGTAFADGSDIPKRFIAWHWGNGVQGPHWVPSTLGAYDGGDPHGYLREHFDDRRFLLSASSLGRGYGPSSELQPVFDRGMNDRVTVVSGTGVGRDGAHYAHAHGWEGLLYDEVAVRDDWLRAADPASPTFIERIANTIRGDAPFGLIRTLVSRTNKYHDHGPRRDLGEPNPRALFDELFGGTDIDPTDGEAMRAAERRRDTDLDILSAVLEDARRLEGRLGEADRQRLEEHFDQLADIQTRIRAGSEIYGGCIIPERPDDAPPWNAEQYLEENIEARDALYNDIIAVALACDLTRAVQYTFTHGQHNAVFLNHEQVPVSRDLPADFGAYDGPGPERGHHENSHKNALANGLWHHRATTFTMSRFAALAQKLSSIPIGDTDLLHHCGIFGWTEQDNYQPRPQGDGAEDYNVYNANNHRHDHIPILLAGEAGGALVSGTHFQPSNGLTYGERLEQSSRVILSLFRAFGVDKASWGNGVRHRTEAFSELLG